MDCAFAEVIPDGIYIARIYPMVRVLQFIREKKLFSSQVANLKNKNKSPIARNSQRSEYIVLLNMASATRDADIYLQFPVENACIAKLFTIISVFRQWSRHSHRCLLEISLPCDCPTEANTLTVYSLYGHLLKRATQILLRMKVPGLNKFARSAPAALVSLLACQAF